MSDDNLTIRTAESGEKAELIALHRRALRELSSGFMKAGMVEALIQSVNSLEDYLLHDRTYYVATIGGQIAACGGWSLRTPGYEALIGDDLSSVGRAMPTVRAMFVNPDFARRGLGRHMLGHIEAQIAAHGFSEAKLTATPMGRSLYERCGWQLSSHSRQTLQGERKLVVSNMRKKLRRDNLLSRDRYAA